MVLQKLSQSFKISLALMFSVLSSGLLQVAPVYAGDDKQVFCNIEGESGRWRAQIGGPSTEHEYPLLQSGAPVFVHDQNDVTAAMDAACTSQYGTTTVTVPTAPATTDPCNAQGVTNNVTWVTTLPTDTATIDWSESNSGATRTATLIGTNVKWSDNSTAAKAFNLPADSGIVCTATTVVTAPTMPATTDLCNSEEVTDNVAWSSALPDDTATIDWSESNSGATRTATLIGTNIAWDDNTTASIVFNLPVDSGQMCPTILPCEDTSGPELITEASDFADYNGFGIVNGQDTRAEGHYEFTEDGLNIYTDDNSSQAKVAWYHSVDYSLANIGVPSMDYASTDGITPGLQIVIDFNGDGTADGMLVGEDVYGDNWWLTNGSAQFVKDGAPNTGGGYGSLYYGTLNEWLASFNEAEVDAVGFSLGSGVYADGVLESLTFGCHEWTFGLDEDEKEKYSICHATGNGGYVLIEKLASSGIYNGHFDEDGPGPEAPGDHQNNGDIIPPFTYQGEDYSQNWDATGQAIFRAGCETPRVPTICTVTNQTYIQPWTYGADTYPATDGSTGSYTFKTDGLYLNTPDIESTVYGLTGAGNTPIVDVDAMSYKTLRLAESAGYDYTAPAYILEVDTNGLSVAGGVKYFFYEPYNNSPPLVQEGVWQTWDALNSGDAKWWMSGTGQALHTWDYFVATYPEAVVTSYGFNQGTYNAQTFAAVQDVTFDCATTHFSVPGQGGGEVLGDQTGGGQGGGKILGTVLPAMLPSTGGNDSPFMIIIASLLAYGAAYFLQGRRMLGRNESLRI